MLIIYNNNNKKKLIKVCQSWQYTNEIIESINIHILIKELINTIDYNNN